MIVQTKNVKDCFFGEGNVTENKEYLTSVCYNTNINNKFHNEVAIFYVAYKNSKDSKNFIRFKFIFSNYPIEIDFGKISMYFYIHAIGGSDGFDSYEPPSTVSNVDVNLSEKINLFVNMFYSYYDIHYKVFSVELLKKFSELVKKV